MWRVEEWLGPLSDSIDIRLPKLMTDWLNWLNSVFYHLGNQAKHQERLLPTLLVVLWYLVLVIVLLPLIFLKRLLSVFVLTEQNSLQWLQHKCLLNSKIKSQGEKWATTLGWFIPRKYRHVMGDILEDCAEMREAGCTEKRIKFHVVYQWLIAVITLVPTAIKTAIIDSVKQVIIPPK